MWRTFAASRCVQASRASLLRAAMALISRRTSPLWLGLAVGFGHSGLALTLASQDVTTLNLTHNKAFDESRAATTSGAYTDSNMVPFACPVTDVPMNGHYKCVAVCVWSCVVRGVHMRGALCGCESMFSCPCL